LASHLPLCRQVGKYNDKKASIHFQPVTNASFSVSHSERTDLSEPAYLLPKSTSNQVIDGSLPEVDIALMFARAKDAMTGQAKAEVHHPFGKVLSYFQTLTRKNNLSICKGKRHTRR
jgi:hypothetical protein